MTKREAIQELAYILAGRPRDSARGKAVLMAIETLEQPEQRKGKWIDATDTSGGDYYRCSECGTYIEKMYFANDYMVNFCPNCGADMREERKNKMNDLISRQAAIDAIFSEPLYESGMKKRDADAVVPAIYEKIKSLPSVQPEQKKEESRIKAKWREKGVYIFECSNCGDHVKEPLDECPNCGAKMEGEE